MNDLVIDFDAGQLTGSGDDVVGPFVLNGRISGGQIVILKQYVGEHSIDYHGTTDGEGVYHGDWSVYGHIGGRWSIRFRTLADGDETVVAALGD